MYFSDIFIRGIRGLIVPDAFSLLNQQALTYSEEIYIRASVYVTQSVFLELPLTDDQATAGSVQEEKSVQKKTEGRYEFFLT